MGEGARKECAFRVEQNLAAIEVVGGALPGGEHHRFAHEGVLAEEITEARAVRGKSRHRGDATTLGPGVGRALRYEIV